MFSVPADGGDGNTRPAWYVMPVGESRAIQASGKEGCPAVTEGLVNLAQQGQEGSGSFLIQLLPFVLILLVFYLLFFRPQQKRRQQEQNMQSSLLPGQEVMTKSGIYGTIVDVHDNDVELEISPGTRIRMIKAGIAEVLIPQDPSGIEDHPDFPTSGNDDDDGPKRS